MPRTPEQAIQRARFLSRVFTPPYPLGMCKKFVRETYDVASDGTPDAIGAWNRAKHRHAQTDPMRIPRGVPVFWRGGRHGHVALSAGDGFCWSTDIERRGYPDRVDIRLIAQQWGMELLGWTEDIDGVRVFTPPPPPPPSKGTHVDAARTELGKAKAKPGTLRARLLRRARRILDRVPAKGGK